jgi:SpoVK/Ycf46/Vps4 family AAA+-type ATPase
MKPYDNNLEHLLDELSRFDLLIRAYLENWLEDFPEAGDVFRGLYVSETEIERIRRNPGFGNTQGILQEVQVDRLREVNVIRSEIDVRIEESLKIGKELRLLKLSKLFGLDPFEIDVLLIGLAPELDLKYEKLYSYLQNDVTKKKPTVDLVLTLLFPTIEEKIKARAYFSPSASLIKNHLIYLLEGEENSFLSLISSFIKIDERIINYLLGFDELDLKIRDFSYVIRPNRSFEDLILPADFKSNLVNLVNWYTENEFLLKLLFCGPPGSGKKTAAEAICKEEGINLLVVNSKVLLEGQSSEIADLVMREALLQNSALYLQDFYLLLEDKERKSSPELLIQALKIFPGWIFLAGKESIKFDINLINSGFIPYSFPLPSYSARKQLWAYCLKDFRLAKEVDMNALASKFRFSGNQIKDAARTAFSFAGEKNLSDPALSMEDLYKGCKAQSNRNLSAFAKRVDPLYVWDDIVLPKDIKDHLMEIYRFVKYKGTVYADWGFDKKLSLGKGLNVLFSGPSGTGKTMAAEIIAKCTGLDLYKIDLSCVISKYIGETEKNLNKIFTEAETSNAILFFDEADALFGKRSDVRDSHDRYANIEINYLLQKMEEYEGVTILATNLRQNMDEAFVRRLHIITDFPFPDEESRLSIWEGVFPREALIGNDVDYGILAREVKLSGGNIKNIALTAAFYAAEDGTVIRMIHIIEAVRREYQKLGRVWNKYYDIKKVFPA